MFGNDSNNSELQSELNLKGEDFYLLGYYAKFRGI
jgi:hypothetical protein